MDTSTPTDTYGSTRMERSTAGPGGRTFPFGDGRAVKEPRPRPSVHGCQGPVARHRSHGRQPRETGPWSAQAETPTGQGARRAPLVAGDLS